MTELSDKTAPRPTGKTYLRILEFDVAREEFTGKSWKYALEAPGNAIGDFNMIDATSDLIVERDDTEGDPALACKDGKLGFPFFTIENVDVIDADHIIVGNDNNLPFSSGRALGKSDDNEMMILKVGELLRVKEAGSSCCRRDTLAAWRPPDTRNCSSGPRRCGPRPPR